MLYVFRKNIIALLFVSGLFIMAGCEFDIEDHPEPERLVTISLTVGSEPASLLKASTASQEEKDIIGDVVFFGVDAKGGYIDTYPFSIGEQSLTISSRIKTLYAVANPTLDMLAATPSETDLQNMTVDFTAAPASSFLMSGSGVVSGSSVSIALVRSVAKIEIKGKKGFKVTGITVENTPDKGYVFPQSPLAVPDGSVPSYTTSDTIFYVAENTRTAAARTQFTVTGTYDGKTASRTITLNLDLVRNKHYSISISPGEQGAGLYSVAVVDEWVDETVTQTVDMPHPYKDGIKILAIGNSYSQNSMQYLYDLLVKVGVEASGIRLVNAYIQGAPLFAHWYTIIDDELNDPNQPVLIAMNGGYPFVLSANSYAPQDFRPNGEMGYVEYRYFTLAELIALEPWDVITMQQVSGYSGMPDTYEPSWPEGHLIYTYDPYLDYLIEYVDDRKPENCKLAWHMTWAYQQLNPATGLNYTDLVRYSFSQDTMYHAIRRTVNKKIVPRLKPAGSFDFIIPSGVAVQNARAAEPQGFGDVLSYDASHMSYLGAYTAAATWVKTITGCDLAKLAATPYEAAPTESKLPLSGGVISTDEIGKIIQAVNDAVATPIPFINP